MRRKKILRQNYNDQFAELDLSLSGDEFVNLKFVRDVMIKPVFLSEDDDSAAIMRKLRKEDTNVCIVVDKNKRFIGEIGVEDLMKFFLYQIENEPLVQSWNIGYKINFLYKDAKQLINKHKSTVKVDDPLNKVIKLLHKENCNYIPVLDKNKRVLGVVTPSSIIDFLQKE